MPRRRTTVQHHVMLRVARKQLHLKLQGMYGVRVGTYIIEAANIDPGFQVVGSTQMHTSLSDFNQSTDQ